MSPSWSGRSRLKSWEPIMRRLDRALAAALAAASLAGCATSALEMAPARPDRPWTPATTGEGEIIAGARPRADAGAGYVLPANPQLATLPPPPPGVAAGKAYTLEDLIDLAERSNPQTRIAWDEARRAALEAGIAEAAYRPQITASVVAAYQVSDTHNAAAGIGVGGENSAHGAISAVSVQWLLFDFGERAAVVEAARQESVIANIAFTAAHQQLIHDVSLAYYAHGAAQARLATAGQTLKDAQLVQAAAEDRRQHGVGTVIEVDQARQATAQAQLNLVQATGTAEDAYLALVVAMGISPLSRLQVADVAGRKLTPALAAPVEDVVRASVSRRPDVLAAYAAEKASLARVRAAQAEFKPKAFLSTTGAYNTGSLDISAIPGVGQTGPTVNINGQRLGASVLAGVTVPLYDGGVRAAALARARAASDSAEARLDHVRDAAVRDIVVASNALRTSLAAYSASQALATASQTSFDAALDAYRSGVGSITELTLAESQLLQAKNAASDAYSTALSAAASLALATGALGAAPE
jgi:outer membrane protein TolC